MVLEEPGKKPMAALKTVLAGLMRLRIFRGRIDS